LLTVERDIDAARVAGPYLDRTVGFEIPRLARLQNADKRRLPFRRYLNPGIVARRDDHANGVDASRRAVG